MKKENITKEVAAARATLWKGLGIAWMILGVFCVIVLIEAPIYVPVAVGLVVFLMGVYFIHLGGKYIKEYGVDAEQREKGKGIAKTSLKKFLAVFIPIFLVALVLAFAMSGGFESISGHENTCGSCGRSWGAGDSGGNYRNIAKTGMCNICEENYQDLKHYLD